MKKNWIGAVCVFGLAGALLAVKLGCNTPKAVAESAPAASSTSAATARVVLVADLSEADEDCRCGKIIRLVRASAARGVSTLEIDPRRSPDDAKKYKAVMTPTVIVNDEAGNEARRYEGEGGETVKKLEVELAKLPGKSS